MSGQLAKHLFIMRYHLHTYGCQMNQRDSEAVAAELEDSGWSRADGEEDADLVLVNTCSVRDKAEEKALGKLGLLCAGKRERPSLLVGVIGCMAQRMGKTIFARLPRLDFAVGPTSYRELPQIADRAMQGETGLLAVNPNPGPDLWSKQPPSARHLDHAVSRFITILMGCNRHCSYCVVPRVRGGEHSRRATDIIAEAKALAQKGTREIVLLGQSVMRYGAMGRVWPEDCPSPAGFNEPFPRLLEALDGIEGIDRIRFTSGHPSGCTPELIRALRELPSVCPCLHLPVQSGSDEVLDRMRRGYTSNMYLETVRHLREALPELSVSTDVIVGFPGETARDFRLTRELMAEADFENAFIFKYSPRPETVAAAWEDDVADDEKQRRHAILLKDQNERTAKHLGRWAGRRVEVLAEGPSPRNRNMWTGRTPNNFIAIFPPRPGIESGNMITIVVERTTAQAIYGLPDRQSESVNLA